MHGAGAITFEDVRRRYNMRVQFREYSNKSRVRRRHAVIASETTGLLLIAFLLLAITLIRYWHQIHWSWR